jgi:hypothetical protein
MPKPTGGNTTKSRLSDVKTSDVIKSQVSCSDPDKGRLVKQTRSQERSVRVAYHPRIAHVWIRTLRRQIMRNYIVQQHFQ